MNCHFVAKFEEDEGVDCCEPIFNAIWDSMGLSVSYAKEIVWISFAV